MTEFLFLGYFNKRVHLAPEVRNDVAMEFASYARFRASTVLKVNNLHTLCY